MALQELDLAENLHPIDIVETLAEQYKWDFDRFADDQIAMAVARISGEPIACALYFFDDSTLYGRYWGSIREFNYLHFELCYYVGIELSIAMGLQRFDAGAQGEHKIIRGFEPRKTHSLHWIKQPNFRNAIGQFIREEALAINHHIKEANKLLPFKHS